MSRVNFAMEKGNKVLPANQIWGISFYQMSPKTHTHIYLYSLDNNNADSHNSLYYLEEDHPLLNLLRGQPIRTKQLQVPLLINRYAN